MTTTDSTNTIIAMVKNEPSQYDWGFRDGYAAGLKEGARRERRALKRDLEPRHGLFEGYTTEQLVSVQQWVLDWLAARKRKGGK